MNRFLAIAISVSAMLCAPAFVSQSATADDESSLGTCHSADGTPAGAYFYPDFYTGWKAFNYAVERISTATAENRPAEIRAQAERLCHVSEGLRRFAARLKSEEKQELVVELNLSQGVASALGSAAESGDGAKLADLSRQLKGIQETAAHLVPQCWLSIASTLHGRAQTVCR